MEFRKYQHIDGLKEVQKFYGKRVKIQYKSDGSNWRVTISRQPIDKNSMKIGELYYNFGSRTQNLIIHADLGGTWLKAIEYFKGYDQRYIEIAFKNPALETIELVGEWLGETSGNIARRDPNFPDRLTIYFDSVWHYNNGDQSVYYGGIPCVQTTEYMESTMDHYVCTPELIEKIFNKEAPFHNLYEGVVFKPIYCTEEMMRKEGFWDNNSDHPLYMKVKTKDYMTKEGKAPSIKISVPLEFSEEERAVVEKVNYEDIIHSFQSAFPEYVIGDNRALGKLIPYLIETVQREVLVGIEKSKQRALSTLIVAELKKAWCFPSLTTEDV